MEIKELAKKYKDYVVGLRREFHQMPEPSLQEYKTSKRIQEELDKMGAKYKVVAGTGVVVEIGGKKPYKVMGILGALAIPNILFLNQLGKIEIDNMFVFSMSTVLLIGYRVLQNKVENSSADLGVTL